MLCVVRHAATYRKLIGKRRGRIVPFAESEEEERRSNAAAFRPTGLAGDGTN